MDAAEHKLSRREVLAGACVAPVLPSVRHPGLDPGPMNAGGGGESQAPVFLGPGFRRDDAVRAKTWQLAFANLTRAQAEIDALAHTLDQDAYDRAVDRQNAALGRVLESPAPDLGAVGAKIALIAAEQAWELSFGAAAFAVLGEGVRRLKRVADEGDRQ